MIFRALPPAPELPLKEQHLSTWFPEWTLVLNEAREKARLRAKMNFEKYHNETKLRRI